MSKETRRKYTSEQKVAIIKKHLVGKIPVSEICEEHGLAVNMFYRWQEDFFKRANSVFDQQPGKPAAERHLLKRVHELEGRLQRKHEVLSELMEEHITLKKILGGFERVLGPE